MTAGLSDGSVRMFQTGSENGVYIRAPISTKKNQALTICGVRFLDETPNLLMVGTTNGLVRLLDLRTRNEVIRFENVPVDTNFPSDILSFDRNSNGRLLSMGTTKRQEHVFILFYDLRTSNQLFKYTESHEDDITSLRFHPNKPDFLCSGSIDGLINIFDIKANSEEDAILSIMNTESSVQKINWHTNNKGHDVVSCITDTNDFKAYEFDGDLIADFDRLKITEIIKRQNEANCNLIDCHRTIDNDMMLLTGSNLNNGSTLRSCTLTNGKLIPHTNFEGNTQIVRESIYDAKTNIFITAGERGFVTIWTPLTWNETKTSSPTIDSSPSGSSKIKSQPKSNKFTPY
ncbi:WD repeat-containing protein 89-like isoform X2 [Calliphora vicina]|uniref:WD repeat-containing protein 89-like isoform X2 n=1 Tax=Calliphora vicina TaxID=7373 RepID=UPI00325BA784